ncbi:MAG: hypothetical protein HY509_01680 [Acidobacteria bacterium]|nr:hypothetical protein [Acidobacteriota bacterium]
MALLAVPGRAGGNEAGSPFANGWRKIVLSGRKALVLHGEVTLTLSTTSYELQELSSPAGPIPAVLLATESRMSLFGVPRVATRTSSYLRPPDYRSLEFIEVKEGRSAKRLLFQGGACRQVRTRPPRGRENLPVTEWEVYEDEELPLLLPGGEPLPEGTALHDSYALLFLASRTDWEGAGGGGEFVVVSRGRPLRVAMRPGRRHETIRRIRNLSTGETLSRQLKEREVILAPVGDGGEETGLLAMRGEVEVWVEEGSGALLEVSGKIPDVPGRTVLKIRAFEPGEAGKENP